MTDNELIEGFLWGDEELFEKIVNNHKDYVYSLSYSFVKNAEDARDISQQVFVKIYTGLRDFDTARPFRPWLRKVVVNAAIDFLRERGVLEDLSLDDVHEAAGAANPSVLKGLVAKEIVDKILASMPAQYRMVLSLRHIEEMSYNEIADSLDIPIGTVKTLIYRAREMFIKKYDKLNSKS
ncbi:MAG: sigma-70 family RNA polymerase sigma factor [Nitrospirae bacterium]|nr:sigma-70 family RNA polymerase sigma factor [Nitrospirota bacterium]